MRQEQNETGGRVRLRAVVVGILLGAIALGGAGAAVATQAQTPRQGGTLEVGVPEPFNGWDPFSAKSRVDYQAMQNICDTLFTYDKNWVPRGMLVDKWSNVGKTWTFNLRRDVKFHDGRPFNARAVTFNLNKMRQGVYKGAVGAITEVKSLGSHRVRIRTNKPLPTLPAILTQQQASIVSPTAYRKLGSAGFNKAPVCTGPFKFVRWNPSSELVLERNKEYWRKDNNGRPYPYLDRVVFKILPDVQAAVAALQAGDVDLITKLPLASVSGLARGRETRVAERPTAGWVYFFLNVPNVSLQKRRAIQLALDRKAIVDSVVFGHGTPALGPIAPTSWTYDPAIARTGFYKATADLARAKRALELAGTPDGFKLKMTYPTEDPFIGVAQVVKAQLASVGIDVELDGREIGAVLDDLFASNFSGALLIDFSGRIDEELGMATFFRSNGPNNFGKYSNPEVDKLLNQAAFTSDRKKRAAAYQQAQKLINQDAPIPILYFPNDIKGLRSNVRGFVNLGDERIALFGVWLSR
jgi:peptide/nickel transport system substrate-binding protein